MGQERDPLAFLPGPACGWHWVLGFSTPKLDLPLLENLETGWWLGGSFTARGASDVAQSH